MSSAGTTTAENETFRCRVCGREFATEADLEAHVLDAGLLR